MLNCYFKSNKAISGAAGVYNNLNSSGYFYNCVFHANQVGTTTGGGGGAIQNNENSNPYFINCTISGNDAQTGGAVYNLASSHPIFFNSIIYKNKSETLPVESVGGSSVEYYNCLVGGIDLSGSNGNLNGAILNNSPFEADPDFSYLPMATGNLQLKTCSPAIDMGGEYFDQPLDIMNNPRIVNNVIDLGAFEKQTNLQYITFYYDNDHDGYGNPNNSVQSCTTPAFYVTNNKDCDDNNNLIHPGASDLCNGLDGNCNGLANENCCNGTTRLYVKWNATGTNSGSSWENAIPRLQDALTKARL
jgi:hypothetical protein